MKRALIAAAALLVVIAPPARAHRVDEYLQAAMLQVSSNRLQLVLRMAPGSAVAGTVLDSIDLDRDGTLSTTEQRSYALRVMRDVAVSIDGKVITLSPMALWFDAPASLREGMGEIQLTFEATIAPARGPRRLSFTNGHRPVISAYLVNSLVPGDSAIRIAAQARDYAQSSYTLDYIQAAATAPVTSGDAPGFWILLAGGCALAALDRARRWLRPSI